MLTKSDVLKMLNCPITGFELNNEEKKKRAEAYFRAKKTILRYFWEGFNITQKKCPRKLKKKLKKRGVYFTQKGIKFLWQEFKEKMLMINAIEQLNIDPKRDRPVKKKSAIIVDIDNTLCESEFIFDEIRQKELSGAAKWDYFNSNINRCPLNAWCMMLVNNYLVQGYDVIFLTARSQEIYTQTEEYISMYTMNSYSQNIHLLMRSKSDISPAWVVKQNWLKKIKEDFHISFAIDDDLENCRMFYENGIPALCPVRPDPHFQNLVPQDLT